MSWLDRLRRDCRTTVESVDALIEELEVAGAVRVDTSERPFGITMVTAWTDDVTAVVYAVGRNGRCSFVGNINAEGSGANEPF